MAGMNLLAQLSDKIKGGVAGGAGGAAAPPIFWDPSMSLKGYDAL